MNIAFATIALFILILPGVIFRRMFYTGDFSRKHIVKTPLDIFIDAIIPGTIIQILGLLFIQYAIPSQSNLYLSFEYFSYLIVGTDNDIHVTQAFNSIRSNLPWILLYNFIVAVVAAWAGYLYRNFIRGCKLDIRYRFFRFPNDWFYLLNGEVLQFDDNSLEHKKFDFICLDVLCKTVNESIIYSGRLKLWYLDKGALSMIILDNVSRRMLTVEVDKMEMKKDTDTYFKIPGDFLVIMCNEMVNINVRYVSFDELVTESASIPTTTV